MNAKPIQIYLSFARIAHSAYDASGKSVYFNENRTRFSQLRENCESAFSLETRGEMRDAPSSSLEKMTKYGKRMRMKRKTILKSNSSLFNMVAQLLSMMIILHYVHAYVTDQKHLFRRRLGSEGANGA